MAGHPNGPVTAPQANGSTHDRKHPPNPYETNPDLIPDDDPFLSKSAHYGRYSPRDGDFQPRHAHWYQADPDVNAYWTDIIKTSCTPENALNVPGTREGFAAGSIVIRVDTDPAVGDATEKYSCANANELSAARKAEEALAELGVVVPVIYFCGEVDGKNVTVESRTPGVSLDVAWRYLTTEQIHTLAQQCRRILERLAGVETAPESPSYVCSGLNSHVPPGILGSEKAILFQGKKEDECLCLVHNEMVGANIIVNDDRVVGLSGWRQCGFFGYERANKVHRQFRALDGNKASKLWAGLYDGLAIIQENGTMDPNTPAAQVKTEPPSVALDNVPLDAAQLDGGDGYPSSKKIAGLKHDGASRASSSERSSPANSTKASSSRRKSAPDTVKKAPAKKTAGQKRKLNDQDNESVDGRRSNTPSSARASKTPAAKKQRSTSVASSPAPEPKQEPKRKVKRKPPKKAVQEEEEDSDDDGQIFCICRKPDNHTWMIGCDGECEDWFHGKCVNIDPRDAELIDRYICPNCNAKDQGHTTWKPMCRLPECRLPARFTEKPPSKYCSDDHGREFMRLKAQHLNLNTHPRNLALVNGKSRSRDSRSADPSSPAGGSPKPPTEEQELGSKGGILTAGDLKAVVMGVSSAKEFRKLGERIISPPAEEPPTEKEPASKDTGPKDTEPKDTEAKPTRTKKLGLDVHANGLTYSPDEESKLEDLRKHRDQLIHREEMLSARFKFLDLVRQRSKAIVERLKQTDPKGGWKDICGFDSRVAWSDEEFDEWRQSELGRRAFDEATPESLASTYPEEGTDQDGDTAMNGAAEDDTLSGLSKGVCTKKRCERHKQWIKVQNEELGFENRIVSQDLAKCEKEAQNVVERAVLRMWAEEENAQVGG